MDRNITNLHLSKQKTPHMGERAISAFVISLSKVNLLVIGEGDIEHTESQPPSGSWG